MKRIRITNSPGWREQLDAALKEASGVEVCFAPGVYVLEKGIVLDDEAKNVTLSGEPGAILTGSRTLTCWEPVTDEAVRERFAPEARDHIRVCDLKTAGIDAVSDFSSRGFARTVQVGHSQLFADGKALALSQYPKGNGFAHISKILNSKADDWNDSVGELEAGFYCDDDRVRQWKMDGHIWALGYWAWDWANTTERVESMDPDGRIQMAPPYGVYSYKVGQRVRFYHILEEVRESGDYYIDSENLRVYLYAFEGMEKAELSVSLLREPMITLSGCKDVTVRGLTFARTCGEVLSAEFCENLKVDNCVMEQVGSAAVDIHEGHGIAVENCTIHHCGDDGVLLYGGNRCTLEPLDAQINNNHIYEIAQASKCYHPGIHMIGVGMEARHNLIHDCPHTAIMFWGNEMKVTDNELYRVVLETGDAGAIYTGRDYTFRGNEVSHNYIHHLGGVGFGAMGIYNDDTVSGTVMRNNYFESLTRGVMMGGGRDFVVQNNVFVKCDPAISFDSRGATPHKVWSKGMVKNMRPRYYFIERYPHCDSTTERNDRAKKLHEGEYASALDAPYITRYPELAAYQEFFKLQEHETSVRLPGQALVENNVFIPRTAFRYRWDDSTKTLYDRGKEVKATRQLLAYVEDFGRNIKRTIDGRMGDLRLSSNFVGMPSDLEDADWGDLRVREDSDAVIYGYRGGFFETIGLQEAKRLENPVFVRSCVGFVPGDTEVKIGLRSIRGGAVSGKLFVAVGEDMKLERSELSFELADGEEKWFTIPAQYTGDGEEDPVINVYSDVPGVRPSRT